MTDIYKKASEIVATHSTLYSLLYDGKIRCDERGMVDRGDAWICENIGNDLFRAILEVRGDIFSSDREVIALALALDL